MRSWVYVWAAPTSLLAVPLVLPALLTKNLRIVDGVLEVDGFAAEFFLRRIVGITLRGGASAMTLGHVVLGRDRIALDQTRRHERVHVRQCERWGPLFVPVYLLASLLAALRGRSPYRDNFFEREAFASAG